MADGTCSIEGCERSEQARGWCQRHYGRWHRQIRYRDPDVAVRVHAWGDAICSIVGCSQTVKSRGWCLRHYERWRRHGDPLGGGEPRGLGESCSINSCSQPVRARSLCQLHYRRWRTHGDPEAVVKVIPRGPAYDRVMNQSHWDPNGCLIFTGYRNESGYGRVKVGRRAVLAHRIVLEHHYGPSDLLGLHACDNPPCVNIAHLRYGTQAENVADTIRRGHHPWWQKA